jgi:hypothetical protein
MKSKMKRQRQTELPRFIVGALAAAGASAANAATVQITFTNSYISTTGGNHLVTDFGGDGVSDIRTRVWASQPSFVTSSGSVVPAAGAGVQVYELWGANIASAYSGNVRIGKFNEVVRGLGTLRDVSRIYFMDTRINGGLVTAGWADITAVSTGMSSAGVQFNRVIFDDANINAPTGITAATTVLPEWGASAVPEPSSLGLLALGAGGLLARRRRAMAA